EYVAASVDGGVIEAVFETDAQGRMVLGQEATLWLDGGGSRLVHVFHFGREWRDELPAASIDYLDGDLLRHVPLVPVGDPDAGLWVMDVTEESSGWNLGLMGDDLECHPLTATTWFCAKVLDGDRLWVIYCIVINGNMSCTSHIIRPS